MVEYDLAWLNSGLATAYQRAPNPRVLAADKPHDDDNDDDDDDRTPLTCVNISDLIWLRCRCRALTSWLLCPSRSYCSAALRSLVASSTSASRADIAASRIPTGMDATKTDMPHGGTLAGLRRKCSCRMYAAKSTTVHDGFLHPHLRYCSSGASATPRYRRSMFGRRAFTAAGPAAWMELVTRPPARSVTFLWQFSPGLDNFSFLVLLAYTAHYRLCNCALYRVGQINRTVFRLDNFVTVSPRKACCMLV